MFHRQISLLGMSGSIPNVRSLFINTCVEQSILWLGVLASEKFQRQSSDAALFMANAAVPLGQTL